MTDEVKSNYWMIPVKAWLEHKVLFTEPVTMEEALELYSAGEFEDVLETYSNGEETCGKATPIGGANDN